MILLNITGQFIDDLLIFQIANNVNWIHIKYQTKLQAKKVKFIFVAGLTLRTFITVHSGWLLGFSVPSVIMGS